MKYFADAGHEMFLISYAEVSPTQIDEFADIGVRFLGNTGKFHIKKFWLTLKDVNLLRRVLRRERIDVLHSHFLGAHVWLAALSRYHPHVITIMGGGDVTGPNWRPDSSSRAKILSPYALRNADYITSWSVVMASAIKPFSGNVPVQVIHGGIHLERFFPGEKPSWLLDKYEMPTNAKVIFSPRLMRALSNIDQIAAAAGAIQEAEPNAYILFARPESAVSSEHATLVKTLLEKNGAIKNSRFVGEITHDTMADFYRLADVTVSIPSTDGTPMTVLESMACGTPTVIGDLPDYDVQYFEDDKTTLMVDVKDPKAIAGAVLRLLRERDLNQRLSAEARHRVVMTGGYEYQMSKMERIYERVTK
jgi:glycosyltransferase involved in cell wall biosynthesis